MAQRLVRKLGRKTSRDAAYCLILLRSTEVRAPVLLAHAVNTEKISSSHTRNTEHFIQSRLTSLWTLFHNGGTVEIRRQSPSLDQEFVIACKGMAGMRIV